MTRSELYRETDPAAFARTLGDPGGVHVGLRSRVDQDGFPAGYDLALAPDIVDRISDLGRIYGLRGVGGLANGAGEVRQPVEFSRLEAFFLARGLRWLPTVSRDAALLDAAERLAIIAEECKSSPRRDERLLIRYVT